MYPSAGSASTSSSSAFFQNMINGKSNNNPSVEDLLVKERTKQILLQTIPFKHSVKINAILALKVDSEPSRCIILDETITEKDRTNLWTQTSLSLANSLFGGAAGDIVANGLMGQISAQLPFFHQQDQQQPPLVDTTTSTSSGHQQNFSPSTSKRKSGRPCKIPQVDLLENNGGALDLSLGEACSPSPNSHILPAAGPSESQSLFQGADSTLETLRSILHSARVAHNGIPAINGDLSKHFLLQPLGGGTDSGATTTLELFRAAKNAIGSMENGGSGGELLSNFPPTPQTCLPIFPTAKPSSHHQQHRHQSVPLAPKRIRNLAASSSSTPKRSGSSKVFSCNQCREHFNSLNQLCKHTFSSHRAFRCTICGANFTQRSNLQRHSLKHVGFKPFICNVCTKAYYRKDHLVRHIEVTHPEADPRSSITVKLTSSECLDYLEKMKSGNGLQQPDAELQLMTNASDALASSMTDTNQDNNSSLDDYCSPCGPVDEDINEELLTDDTATDAVVHEVVFPGGSQGDTSRGGGGTEVEDMEEDKAMPESLILEDPELDGVLQCNDNNNDMDNDDVEVSPADTPIVYEPMMEDSLNTAALVISEVS